MSVATTTPAVTLDNTDTLNDETLLVEYRNAKAAGDKHRMNRHFSVITERVKRTVQATANKVMLDANDRDIAVWTAIGKLAMDDEAFGNVLTAVRNGENLANCVAAFITPDSMKAELNQGRSISATGKGGGSMSVTPTDFTADETMVTVSGTSYTMDALDEALDAALYGAPTAADEACDWFRETTNGHLTTDEQDVLLHSSGITREVDDYLDDLAVTDPARAARAFNAVNPNPKNAARRIGPARLPQEHVGNIVGHDQQWVSATINDAENAIYANAVLLPGLRGGSQGNRRVIPEDIATTLIDWLVGTYDAAGVAPTEDALRLIPEADWHNAMAGFAYKPADYSAEFLDDLIEAVIAGVLA